MLDCLFVVNYATPVDEFKKYIGVLYQETEFETIQHSYVLFCQVK
jgi:hypothetical protein